MDHNSCGVEMDNMRKVVNRVAVSTNVIEEHNEKLNGPLICYEGQNIPCKSLVEIPISDVGLWSLFLGWAQ